MEHSNTWETVNLASKHILCLSQKPKFCYGLHKSWPLNSTQNHVDPLHVLIPYFPKIHFSIIFPSILRTSSWSLSFRFSHENPLFILILPQCPQFYLCNSISWWVQSISVNFSHIQLFDSCYLPHVISGYSQHLFWRVLSFWLSEGVRDKSHTCTSQVAKLYFVCFRLYLVDCWWNGKILW